MPAVSLSTLPFDVLETILSHLDARKDVLALSLLSSTFRDLAIPRHLHYREIHCPLNEDDSLWIHLAQRRDLALNVRTLVIQRPSPDPVCVPKSLSPYALEASASPRHPVWDAVSNMQNLRVLEVYNGWRRYGKESMTILSGILGCAPPTMDKLVIHGLMEEWTGMGVAEARYVLDIYTRAPPPGKAKAIVLPNTTYLPSLQCLRSLIVISPSIQVLELPSCVGYSEPLATSFAECRFHALRELTLGANWKFTNGVYVFAFLAAHPRLRSLSWHGHYPGFDSLSHSLPVLEHLTIGSWTFLQDVVRGQGDRPVLKSLEYLSPLDPSYIDPVRAADSKGAKLHTLTVACPTLPTLETLTILFPYVTHLRIPGGLSVTRTRLPKAIAGQFGNARRRALLRRPSLKDVLALFPNVEFVGGMTFQSSAHMRKVLVRFPQLRGFDSPCFFK
ncbi:hypothetical protein BV25DRAFT_1821423 [Artomyces pyxidatus]|uniref:Uncharacterized protein n=1 Tax=Artomyces pyxidatus TaxID=48021 RepID=A0ACB8TC27_9AGAM|nr:hypothetical protein BV25DRAFT_1821423 [Artomyces pyxidatus]